MSVSIYSRRSFLQRSLLLGGAVLTARASAQSALRLSPLQKARRYLLAQQHGDGAWRSARYSSFRTGDALTPLVLWALGSSEHGGTGNDRGVRWLRQLAGKQFAGREPWEGLVYPLFTAAYAAQTLAQRGESRAAARWAGLIEQLRVSPDLGWPRGSSACGAWGDSSVPPKIPNAAAPAPDLFAPNISATVLALQALAASGRAASSAEALPFLATCQNYSASGPGTYDDGGFSFAPGDPVRNKAGSAGIDENGRERFRSYGAATCDGLLALRLCGMKPGAPAFASGATWMQQHAAGAEHGGNWPPGRTAARESLRYYHAQAFAALLAQLAAEPGLRSWAADQSAKLRRDLIASQNPDGSWANPYPDGFEDDPLLATAFATRALSLLG